MVKLNQLIDRATLLAAMDVELSAVRRRLPCWIGDQDDKDG